MLCINKFVYHYMMKHKIAKNFLIEKIMECVNMFVYLEFLFYFSYQQGKRASKFYAKKKKSKKSFAKVMILSVFRGRATLRHE